MFFYQNLKETSAVSTSKPVTKIKNQEKSAQKDLSSKKDEIILKVDYLLIKH